MGKQQNKYKSKILKNILFLILILLSYSIRAQVNDVPDYSNPKTYEIGGIMVNGANNLNKKTLITITDLSVGEKIKIPGDDISTAITKLWEQGLFSDVDIAIEKIVDDVIKENPKNVELFKSGKDKLFGFFVGQVMKKTDGKANPKLVNDILKKKLN